MALQKPARDASDLGYLVAPHSWTPAGMRGVLLVVLLVMGSLSCLDIVGIDFDFCDWCEPLICGVLVFGLPRFFAISSDLLQIWL